MHLCCDVWLLIYYWLAVLSKADYSLVVDFVLVEFSHEVVSAKSGQFREARIMLIETGNPKLCVDMSHNVVPCCQIVVLYLCCIYRFIKHLSNSRIPVIGG